MNKQDKFLKSILGEDFEEALQKSEIQKLSTMTMTDPEEIKTALQIVPRTILLWLFENLKDKKQGDVIALPIHFEQNAVLNLNKHGSDNYSGDVVQDGRILVRFRNRTLPSIGLILLTTFELYDMSMLNEVKTVEAPSIQESISPSSRINDFIEQRMMLMNLVENVVERKINEREAIDRLLKERLFSALAMQSSMHQLHEASESAEEEKKEEHMEQEFKAPSKLKQFLDRQKKRREEPVELDKSEFKCPDCSSILYKSGNKDVNLCICYGDKADTKIKIKKAQNGKVSLDFPKDFEIENVEMLLDSLKK